MRVAASVEIVVVVMMIIGNVLVAENLKQTKILKRKLRRIAPKEAMRGSVVLLNAIKFNIDRLNLSHIFIPMMCKNSQKKFRFSIFNGVRPNVVIFLKK